MKIISALLLLPLVFQTASAETQSIQDVVKLLQGLLEQSKTDSLTDRNTFAKTSCQCSDHDTSLKDAIETAEETITENEGIIDKFRGQNAGDSQSSREKQDKHDETEATRDTAVKLRLDENTAWIAADADWTESISDMTDAIEELAKVGGDQTESTGADHEQFMAGTFLQKKQHPTPSRLMSMLKALTGFATNVQQRKLDAFIQAPFTGTYTSQSGEIVGILKNMKDTFVKDQKDAAEKEKNDAEAHAKALKAWNEEMRILREAIGELESNMEDSTGQVTSARNALATAQGELATAQEELEYNTKKCEAQQKAYDARTLSRTNEQAALSQAISILNSDEAFAVTRDDAVLTKSATAFLQLGSSVNKALHEVIAKTHSSRVAALVALIKFVAPVATAKDTKDVSGKNPFKTIMLKIDELIKVIEDEHEADQVQFDWCTKENATNNDEIDNVLDTEILSLEAAIIDDKSNIKKTGETINTLETDYKTSQQTRKTETETRAQENAVYRDHVAKASLANSLVAKALNTLKAYYLNADGESSESDDWNKGVSADDANAAAEAKRGSGDSWAAGKSTARQDPETTNTIIKLLTDIRDGTATEEAEAHQDESNSQTDYECITNKRLNDEKVLAKEIANGKEALAKYEKALIKHEHELKATEQELADTKAYLAKIAPGCAFIAMNKEARDLSRDDEKAALEEAQKILQGSDVFKKAELDQKNDDFGKCRDWKDEPAKLGNCEEAEADASCLACLAGVTRPAWCTGHKTADSYGSANC